MSELRRNLEIIGSGERTVTTEDLCLVVSNLNSRIMHSGKPEICFEGKVEPNFQNSLEQFHIKLRPEEYKIRQEDV